MYVVRLGRSRQTDGGVADNLPLRPPSSIRSHSYEALWVKCYSQGQNNSVEWSFRSLNNNNDPIFNCFFKNSPYTDYRCRQLSCFFFSMGKPLEERKRGRSIRQWVNEWVVSPGRRRQCAEVQYQQREEGECCSRCGADQLVKPLRAGKWNKAGTARAAGRQVGR